MAACHPQSLDKALYSTRHQSGDVTFLVPEGISSEDIYGVTTFDVGKRSMKTIKAHKLVLVTRCARFQTMFSSGMVESAGQDVVIRDCSARLFELLLRWIYLSSFNVSSVSGYVAASLRAIAQRLT